jgi:hypothetical protein
MTIRNWRKQKMKTDYCNCNKQLAYVPSTPTVTSFTNVGIDSWIAPAYVNSVEYLVVGGGGGGGGAFDTGSAGGGGGGLVLSGTLTVVPGNTYSITVGAGGARGIGVGDENTPTRSETNGGDGGTSKFATKIALGGGGGYRSRYQTGGTGYGGFAANGLTAPTGGNGAGSEQGGENGGGGGGNASAGGSSTLTPLQSKTGGAGLTNNISSSNVTYGAGGVGGQVSTNLNGSDGANNTGNGGGGAASFSSNAKSGGNGGSGIVILKYYV